jgi:hypothetical protein
MHKEHTIIKSERRERKRQNNRRMGVSGRSLLTTLVPTIDNANKEKVSKYQEKVGTRKVHAVH